MNFKDPKYRTQHPEPETRNTFAWGHTRRFNSYPDYLKKVFGGRAQKVALDAGFTCPNRDGTKGTGGCTFCSNDAFNPSYCVPSKSVTQQIKEGIEFHENRYRRAKHFLAYFQAYSNTYKPIDELIPLFEEALAYEGMAGLVIGTRPDCIDDEKLDYLKKISEKAYVIIEYGIESTNNEVLNRINRGHTFEDAVEAVKKTADRGIKTGAHFIFGLPGESKKEMLDSVDIISQMPLDNIKFHQLEIIRGTKMAEEFEKYPSNFPLFETMEEYLDFVIRFLEKLNPAFVVERIAGEVPPWFNMRTNWNLRYDQVLKKLEKMMEERDTWQGKNYKK